MTKQIRSARFDSLPIFYASKSPCAAGEKPPTGGFYVEMMGFLGAGNNPMVGMTVSVAVAVEEASK